LRYFAVVRNENCSGLKAAASSKVYGSEIVSSPLLVHAKWTPFSAWLHTSVPYLEYAVKCGMIFKVPRSCLVFPAEDNMQKYSKRF
jgi:hypothetical protein